MVRVIPVTQEMKDTGNNYRGTDLGNPVGVLNLVIRLCKPCFVLLY